jgi:hypothetical protein
MPTRRGSNRALFVAARGGPALLTLLMIGGSAAYYPWRHYDSWMAYAIELGGLAVVLWHLALTIVARPVASYLMYAFANITLYVIFGFFGLVLVTGDSL